MGCILLPAEDSDRLYGGQKPREKFQSYRDGGFPDSINHDKIRVLAGHIYKIICLIDEQRWEEANVALNEENVARSCGIRIDSPFKVAESIDGAVLYAQQRAMWVRGSAKITIPQVALGKRGTAESTWTYPEEIPQLAMRLFPIWLEEWIHAFQWLIAGPVSDETVAFEKSPCFKDGFNPNEVDIYVIYKDLNWNKDVLLETENRYEERIAFADHEKEGNSRQCCTKAG